MFEGWDDFYLLIGSAGGALIGLLFVVVTLTTGSDESRTQRGQALYMTPNVFHFGSVLVISGMAMAPGLSVQAEALIVGVVALAGLAVAGRVTFTLFTSKAETPPHWSDPWYYGVGPLVLYVALACAVVAIWSEAEAAPRAVAGVTCLLMLLGIRNAWDLVTYLAPRAEK